MTFSGLFILHSSARPKHTGTVSDITISQCSRIQYVRTRSPQHVIPHFLLVSVLILTYSPSLFLLPESYRPLSVTPLILVWYSVSSVLSSIRPPNSAALRAFRDVPAQLHILLTRSSIRDECSI
jgi:hypothetical protein